MTDRLAQLERLARETENPAFCWQAIAASESPADLPGWCWLYLRDAANRLLALDPDPRTLPGAILEALGLTGPGGPGAFKRAASAERKQAALEHMTKLIPAHGIDTAAELIAQQSDFSAGTLKTYYHQHKRGAK